MKYLIFISALILLGVGCEQKKSTPIEPRRYSYPAAEDFSYYPGTYIFDGITESEWKTYAKRLEVSGLLKWAQEKTKAHDDCLEACYTDYRTTFKDCRERCESKFEEDKDEFHDRYYKEVIK